MRSMRQRRKRKRDKDRMNVENKTKIMKIKEVMYWHRHTDERTRIIYLK